MFILNFIDFFFVFVFFFVLFGFPGLRYPDTECPVTQSQSTTPLQCPMIPKWDPCDAAHPSKETAAPSWEMLQWAF
ncbi:hypothetical protein JOM56_004416 [Amanita muscaria]